MKKRLSRILLCLMMLFTVVLPVFAASTSSDAAMSELQQYVYKGISGKSYTLAGGGSTMGDTILVEDKNTNGTSSSTSKSGVYYSIDESVFTTLTPRAQEEVVNDIAELSQEKVEVDKTTGTTGGGVTNETVEDWWKKLQTTDGVGTKFLNVILQDTKPDFISANAIFRPFNGVIGVVLGVISIAVMSMLGIVIISDIAYITIPMFRLFVSENESNEGSKIPVSKLISHAAISAVKEGEGEQAKQVLSIYLKRRIVMMIFMGICLMYLVQGQIYVLVGWILDLMSGFLKF